MKIGILLPAIASGLLFCLFLYLSLMGIDSDWYTARDDGVITLSAARNLVDEGFIGVNPSGPIVEASSAPVQLFLYALVYRISRVNYMVYSMVQSYASYFLIGVFFFLFFARQPVLGLGLAVIAAAAISFFSPFIEWHSSGMENAITNFLFILSVFLIYRMVSERRVRYIYAALLFLASLSRIDSIYHVAPLLLIFALFWKIHHKNNDGFYILILTSVLWLAFAFWHNVYFGQLFPNTAYAQGISVTDRLMKILSLDKDVISQSVGLSKNIILKLGLWMVVPAFAIFLFSKKSTENIIITVCCASLMTTAIFNPWVFGVTRIDPVRTTSFATLISALLVCNWIYFARRVSLPALLVIPLIGAFYQPAIPPRYYLGWSTRWFEPVHERFVSMAKDNDIKRPTIANADLGAMTWHKVLNDIDMGLLGNPVMAHLKNDQLIADYIIDYAAPDFIEAHEAWIFHYCKSLFKNPRFNEKYIQYLSDYNIEQVCQERPMNAPAIYWIRKDIMLNSPSNERSFLNDFQKNLSISRINDELNLCSQRSGGDPKRCSYIARTVFQFIPDLRRSGTFDDAYRLFLYPPDQALLIGWKDSQAYTMIIHAIQDDRRQRA